MHIYLQRSFEETQHVQEEYHDPDHRNANYNASPSHHYSQNNQYAYEVNECFALCTFACKKMYINII